MRLATVHIPRGARWRLGLAVAMPAIASLLAGGAHAPRAEAEDAVTGHFVYLFQRSGES